jgi:thioredoxin reductase
MPLPSRNSLAVIGAGPVGLETALAALDAGLDVHVFERGPVGAHPAAWGHVRMFTPWRMNVGPAMRARLERNGWTMPDPEACATGQELVDRLLLPVAALPELKGRLHTHAQVVHVGRRGLVRSDHADRPAERGAQPFRLLVRDQGGRENFIHAFALVDASGVYGQPNRAGDGGIPARQELYLAPQMSYHLDDVLGLARERYAGRSVLVLGGGASAVSTVDALARLAAEAPGTSVVWVTRAPAAAVLPVVANDPLPHRAELHARGRALVAGADPAVRHVGGAMLEGFEYNSATHRYRANLRIGEQPRIEETDRVIVNTGYGPDLALLDALQLHTCWATGAPIKLATVLLGVTDCMKAPAADVELLAHPEPNCYVLGHKSYGRSSHFLLETGYQQAAGVVAHLAREMLVA